ARADRRAGQARGVRGCPRVPEPHQVRDAALAHRARRSRRQGRGRAGLDGVDVMAIDRDQIEKLVVETIRTVHDPEIPVNIYELGLIYGVSVDDSGAVAVTMTLTAPGCPEAQSLPLEVEERVRAVPGVTSAKVDVTFDPPWDQSRMSEAARLQLGLL